MSKSNKIGSIFLRKNTDAAEEAPKHDIEQDFPTYDLGYDGLWDWLDNHFPESKPIELEVGAGPGNLGYDDGH